MLPADLPEPDAVALRGTIPHRAIKEALDDPQDRAVLQALMDWRAVRGGLRSYDGVALDYEHPTAGDVETIRRTLTRARREVKEEMKDAEPEALPEALSFD